jgi:hypothetical protein
LWEQAVWYQRQAGLKAQARSAHRQAASFFENAIAALASELTIDLRSDLNNSLVPLVDFDRLFQNLKDAQALTDLLNDTARQVWVLAGLAHYYWRRGEHSQVLNHGQRALTAATVRPPRSRTAARCATLPRSRILCTW